MQKIKTDAGIKNSLQEWKKCCNFVAKYRIRNKESRQICYEDKSYNHNSTSNMLLLLGTNNYRKRQVARGDITSVVGYRVSAKGIRHDKCQHAERV